MMKVQARKEQSGGFTFIELLVVVAIIAVLSGVAMVSFQITNRKARDTRRKADLEQIRSALELCRAETGAYPESIDTTVTCDAEVYLNNVPEDPKEDGSTYSYTYDQTSDTSYQLCATTLEQAGETSPYCVTNP